MQAVKEVKEVKIRVDKLEYYMMSLAYEHQKTEMALQQLSEEMKEFKNEMRQEMKEFKDEMKEFKDEMKTFKDEIQEFKETADKEFKRMNKQWGELANKMGTVVEDIVFPASRPVIEKYFDIEVEELCMGRSRKKNGYSEEFDVIAVGGGMVFLIEVKATPRKEYVRWFKDKQKRFLDLFPEYKKMKLVPIFASLRFGDEGVLKVLTKEKIFAMAYREWEYMDILNFEELRGYYILDSNSAEKRKLKK